MLEDRRLARRQGLRLPQADGHRHGRRRCRRWPRCCPTRTSRTWPATPWSGFRAPEAAQALRDALPKLDGALKIGVIGSLGVRRDAASVPALAALLGDADAAIAAAAACALGDIGTPDAAKALTGSQAGRPRAKAGRRPTPRWPCAEAPAGRRQEGRSPGRLQVAHRRRPAQARPPGRHPRHAGLRRQVGLVAFHKRKTWGRPHTAG